MLDMTERKSFSFCGLELPNNIFLAPMAGITNRAFRRVALSLGCGMAWTEMISAEGLVRGDRKTEAYLPDRDEGSRVAVQIFGRKPEVLRDAAAIIDSGPAALIDINLGCPAPKVARGGSGAALLREPDKVRKILEAVCRVVQKPVTVKIRSGWDEQSRNAVEVAKVAKDSGAAAVIIHGRTAKQGFSGRADWGVVRDVVQKVGVTVVGSGDLTTPPEVATALRESGCAAVMIGRASRGNPWIFQLVEACLSAQQGVRPSVEEVGRVMLWHLEMSLTEFGPHRGLVQMRRPLTWYSRGWPGAGDFRRRIIRHDEPAMVRREIESFVRAALETSSPKKPADEELTRVPPSRVPP